MKGSYTTPGDCEITSHYDDVPPGNYKIVMSTPNSSSGLEYLLRVFYEVEPSQAKVRGMFHIPLVLLCLQTSVRDGNLVQLAAFSRDT